MPVALYLQRRWWPGSSLTRFTDASCSPSSPLGAGRVLGPQFIVNDEGHLTEQSFGVHYLGQFGRRVPVPLIQGAEDSLLWLVLLSLARTGEPPRPRRDGRRHGRMGRCASR